MRETAAFAPLLLSSALVVGSVAPFAAAVVVTIVARTGTGTMRVAAAVAAIRVVAIPIAGAGAVLPVMIAIVAGTTMVPVITLAAAMMTAAVLTMTTMRTVIFATAAAVTAARITTTGIARIPTRGRAADRGAGCTVIGAARRDIITDLRKEGKQLLIAALFDSSICRAGNDGECDSCANAENVVANHCRLLHVLNGLWMKRCLLYTTLDDAQAKFYTPVRNSHEGGS